MLVALDASEPPARLILGLDVTALHDERRARERERERKRKRWQRLASL